MYRIMGCKHIKGNYDEVNIKDILYVSVEKMNTCMVTQSLS